MYKGLVISGGGAFGAYGVGTLKRLNKSYDLISGISTGSLMAQLVALKKWEVLEKAYTTTTNNIVFDGWYGNPFNKKGNIKIPNLLYKIIKSFILNKTSIGTTNNLRKTIDKFITKEDFDKVLEQDIELLVGAQNLSDSPSRVKYFSNREESYEDFKDWIWASSNVPVVMSLLEKNGSQWCDGGISEAAAISNVILKGYKEVDVIMNRFKHPYEVKKSKNIKDVTLRSLAAMRDDINQNDVMLAVLLAKIYKVNLKIWWIPKKLADNSLSFDNELMTKWLNDGYETAYDPDRIDEYNFK